jgi:hypothetical protein
MYGKTVGALIIFKTDKRWQFSGVRTLPLCKKSPVGVCSIRPNASRFGACYTTWKIVVFRDIGKDNDSSNNTLSIFLLLMLLKKKK